MTTTAKILVVLNLLLAVLFLGFSAASMSGRLDMQATIKKLETEKKDAENKVAIERQAADKAAAEAKTHETELKLATKTNVEQKKSFENTIDNLNSENVSYRKEAGVAGQRIKQVTDEATQRKEEIDQARKQNQELVAKNVEAANNLSTARDTIQELKSQIERLNDRIRLREEEHRDLLNYLASVKVTLPPREEWRDLPTATQPPPVEGVVLDVQQNGKFLEISLGENDGLRSGHRLQIFRRVPDARYVGDAEVIMTKTNKAVLRPIDNYLTPPKKGDVVAISTMLNRG